MTIYKTPVEDIRFVLEEVAGLEEICALPGFEEASTELAAAVLDEAARLAEEVIAPLNRIGDRAGAVLRDGAVTTPPGFKAAYRTYAEGGWIGLSCDPTYGGQGLPRLLDVALGEVWNAAGTAFALCPMLTHGAIEALQHHASDALRQRYLPKLISGEWTGTMNLTEPQAGSDLAAVRTRAVPEGEHFRITGTKIFITYGEHDYTDNIVHLVLARLPDAPAGVKGISLFVVPKFLVNDDGSLGARNDAHCVSLEHKLGIHASPTAVMVFGEKGGAIGHLVGEANRGLEYMFTMMNHARLAVGLEGIGIAERACQQALAYAMERVQGRVVGYDGSRPIAYHPDVRRMLMTMRSQIEAMRALACLTAASMDRAAAHPESAVRAVEQARVDLLIPVVKGWCTEIANQVAYDAVQVHGGMGFIEETGVAQHLRDARIITIYEGTTGIQANDLMGRKVARDHGEAALVLFDDMRLTVEQAAEKPALQLQAQAMRQALYDLEAATLMVVGGYATAPGETLMGAMAYLNLFGVVAGGWALLKSALAAQRRLDQSKGDARFNARKVASARFYGDQVLPRTATYLQQLRSGASSLEAADIVLG